MLVTFCDQVKQAFLPLTMVDNVMVHEMLHEADSCGPVWSFFMTDQPVCKLLGHKAVRVSTQVVTSFLYQLSIVESQPWGVRSTLAVS